MSGQNYQNNQNQGQNPHPHLDSVKNAFISGEPGTSGREPFENPIGSSGQQHSSGQGLTGTHSGAGLSGQHSGSAQGPSIGSHSSGLTGTGEHHSSGLTGTGASGLSGQHSGSARGPEIGSHSSHSHTGGDHSSTGLTGSHNTGAGHLGSSEHQHQHNAQTGAQAGAVGIAGAGLDGLSHAPQDRSTGHGTGHVGSSHDAHTGEKKGIVEKVKEAVSGHKDSNTTSSHSTTSNTHSSTHPTSGAHSSTHPTSSSHSTGTGAYPASHTGDRDVVDKINDALPGTPAKTDQHYGTSHNPTTQGQHHGGSAIGAGVAGAGAGTAVHNSGVGHSSSGVGHSTSGVGHSSTGGVGSGLTGASHSGQRDHGDRVGALDQSASKYEGDLNSGPRTSGAAGTERFDSNQTGARAGHENTIDHDTSQRAPGKSAGGISGLLATSDKDFTGRERKGEGAYADTDGLYKLNSTGPGGNSALTGREGNLDNNPVAQAASRDGNPVDAHNSHATGTTHGATGEHGEKKGFLAKVKDALS